MLKRPSKGRGGSARGSTKRRRGSSIHWQSEEGWHARGVPSGTSNGWREEVLRLGRPMSERIGHGVLAPPSEASRVDTLLAAKNSDLAARRVAAAAECDNPIRDYSVLSHKPLHLVIK
jgi:hypothetical protein